MSRGFGLLSCALALVLVTAAPLALPARAQTIAPPALEDVTDPPLVEEFRVGGWAAVGCGIFTRAMIATAGTQIGINAGAIACCGYMLFEAFTHKPH